MGTKKDKRVKRKVIGWTSYDEDDFTSNESGILSYGGDEKTDEAVARDIEEHGYLFTGEDHQDGFNCAPVTDDYVMIRYSTRRFGYVMAKGRGGNPDKEYSLYAWNFGWDRAKKVFPTGDLTVKGEKQPERQFEVTKKLFDEIYAECGYSRQFEAKVSEGEEPVTEDEIDKYIESLGEVNQSDKIFLLPVIPEKGSYYWIGDKIKLTDSGRILWVTVGKLLAYSSIESFKEDIARRIERGDNEYVYDMIEIEKAAKNGRFLLLGLTP